jgi:hypothetical protein
MKSSHARFSPGNAACWWCRLAAQRFPTMRNVPAAFSRDCEEGVYRRAVETPRRDSPASSHDMAQALLRQTAIVNPTREELMRSIAHHRETLIELEARLGELATPTWPPVGFYLTFYIVAGTTIGILGSLASFIFNVVGSLLVNQDPLRILRVYGTVFLGPKALTTDDLNFFMLVAVVHFSVGAIAGAVFHVLVNRFVPARTGLQIVLGALYGLVMWVVNFYVVIAWLQPRLFGEAYVLELMPIWIAALTHVVYGLTLGLLQPLGRFVPYRPAVA